MKRTTRIIAIGAVLLVSGYWGFPLLFKSLDSWSRHRSMHRQPIPSLRDFGPPSYSSLQPGLGFFQDIDEVKFTCARSFDGSIEITARRPYLKKGTSPLLESIIRKPWKPENERIEHSEREISEEVFTELRNFVLRQDLIERSLLPPALVMDGSIWILEGKKGEFTIRHVRYSPLGTKGEETFIEIGKRFLDLAGITIPDDKFY